MSRRSDHDHIAEHLHRLEHKLDLVLSQIALILKAVNPKAVDLNIKFGEAATPTKGTTEMAANKKATGPDCKCPCLAPKSSKMKAVMPDVTLTDPLPKTITLQPLDAQGAVVVLTPADVVTGTLTSGSPSFVVTQAADSVHYTGTIPANTPQGSAADLTATLKGTIQGAPADLSASVRVILNVPPSPVAVDLAIVFA